MSKVFKFNLQSFFLSNEYVNTFYVYTPVFVYKKLFVYINKPY